jgi:hypothetical protein
LTDRGELFGLLFALGSFEPMNSLYEKPPFTALRAGADVVEVGFADRVPVLGHKIFDFFLLIRAKNRFTIEKLVAFWPLS